MTRLYGLTLIAPLLVTHLAGQVPDWFNRPVVLPVDSTPIDIRHDIDYKGRPELHIGMDVYRPKGSGPVPAVVLVHGGPIRALPVEPRTAGQLKSLGRILAAHGIVAVTFSHRLRSADAIDTAAADVRDAVQYVIAHADSLGIDATRLCIWAISAGGTVIGPAVREFRNGLRCLVSYYNVLNATFFQTSARAPSLNDLMTRDSIALPPTFVVRAGRDDPRLNSGIDAFVALAVQRGTALELHTYPEGHHAFDIMDDTEASRRLLGQTVEFLTVQLFPNSLRVKSP